MNELSGEQGSVSFGLGSNFQLLELCVGLQNQQCQALIDSGATHNFISTAIVSQLQLKIEQRTQNLEVKLADGFVVNCNQQVACLVDFGNNFSCNVDFVVVPKLSQSVILGMPWLSAVNPVIDWRRGIVSFTDHPVDDLFCVQQCNGETGSVKVELCTLKGALKLARQKRTKGSWFAVLRTAKAEQTATTSAGKFQDVIDEFSDVFAPAGNPPKRDIEHAIDLIDESVQPAKPRTYRMSQDELAECRRQLDALLEKGWIRPSCSPYGHPILFVRKKTGDLRMCVDYRLLNQQTRLDRYPIPRIDQLLDTLTGASVFSLIDLQSGYHQVRIKEGHEFKTAFTSRWGLYEFLVMPFGLCNAPATFQRLMHKVLGQHLDDFVIVYLDDILVFSKNEVDHAEHLRWVFSQLRQHQLHAKQSKCSFGMSSVQYLGHVVSSGTVAVDPAKVQAVQEWPTPVCSKDVQSFIGLANYYHRFIPHFAEIAEPLTSIMGKQSEFVWGQQQQFAFDQLKQKLCSAPVLCLPDLAKPFVLETDASNVAIGAVLQQDQGKGLQPVSYFSRKLNSSERNYPVHEREQYAVVLSCLKWRHYLDGQVTRVVTDHRALTHLQTQPNLSPRQVRWYEKLCRFKLEIEYRKGVDAVVPDALSRRADLTTLVVEPSWLARVSRAQLDESDVEMAQLCKRASSTDGAFVLRQQGDLKLLYKVTKSRDLLVIPATNGLRETLLLEFHDSALGAHFGVRKTVDALQRRVWWPKMEAIVRTYVRGCPVCQRVKDSTLAPAGELQSLPVPAARFDSWSMDFVTNLPLHKGYNAIFTCVDRLTKLTRLTPCYMGDAALTAVETAQLFFDRVVRDFGVPTVIVSDRDPRFTSAFWTALMEIVGTRLAFSSAHHPQSDGQTERQHRTLEQILRSFILEYQVNWVDMLGQCEFAINNSANASTGTTPFELVYGTSVQVPADHMGGQHKVEVAQQWVEKLSAALASARQSMQRAQAWQKQSYDAKHRPVAFSVDDQVLLSTKHLVIPGHKKLVQRFVGPFRVTRCIGKQAYELELSKQYKRLHPVFHVSLLKQYVPGVAVQIRSVPEPVLVGDEVEYEVDRILRHRKRRGRGGGDEYLVLWKGFDISEATWEKASNLEHAQDVLQQYLASV